MSPWTGSEGAFIIPTLAISVPSKIVKNILRNKVLNLLLLAESGLSAPEIRANVRPHTLSPLPGNVSKYGSR
jgi:hypothetical protein